MGFAPRRSLSPSRVPWGSKRGPSREPRGCHARPWPFSSRRSRWPEPRPEPDVERATGSVPELGLGAVPAVAGGDGAAEGLLARWVRGGGTGTLPAAPVPEPPQTGARQAATSPSTSATTPPPWRAPRPPSPSPCASPARRRRCPTAAWCGARTAPSTVSARLTPPALSLVGAVATPVPRSASGPRRHPRHAGRPRLPGAAGRGLGRRLPRRAALSPQRLGQARKIRLRVVDVG